MTEHWLEIDGAEIHVEVSGSGPAIVLIHGLGLQGSLWNRAVEAFGDGFQLIRIDLRSAPHSREQVLAELTLARWAEDVVRVLDRLELERPVLVGHSLGASIALKVGLERPGRAAALVLVNADPDLSNLAPRMRASVERIEANGLEGWLEAFWSKNPPFSQASLQRDPAILAEYRALLAENDPGDYCRQCLAIANAENLNPRLGELDLPVLVFLGGDDDRTLPEQGQALAREIPGARLVELADIGHTIPLETPDELVRAVTELVTTLAAPAADRPTVLRADTTPRNAPVGPFGHIDSRWVVGPHSGATAIAFGQSTYPLGVTHENHHHPHAEEVVVVLSGRGTQIIGATALDMGPGDMCFIPKRTPHRISGTSEDEDLVILWALGGAADMETAGYVPLPDDIQEVQG